MNGFAKRVHQKHTRFSHPADGKLFAERPLKPETGTRKNNLQKKVYQRRMDHHLVSDIKDTIFKGICKNCARRTVDFGSVINLQSCMDTLSSLNSSFAIKVLRTWVNGWASSHRYHEAIVYPCSLGCKGGLDDLRHCVQCPHPSALTKVVIPEISSDPLARTGSINLSIE